MRSITRFALAIETDHGDESDLHALIDKYDLHQETKAVLKRLFPRKRVMKLRTDKETALLKDRYMHLLNVEGVKDFRKTQYSSAKALSLREHAHIYATKKHVIKCYFNWMRPNDYEGNEFKLHTLLTDEEYSVPRFVERFDTLHYRCYVMERLEKTFDTVLMEHSEGLGEENAKVIAQTIVPVIERIHKAGRYYRDFSLSNLALHEDSVYLLDFGATNAICALACCRFTPRYASRGMVDMKESTVFDEYEAFGYVLLDIAFSYIHYKSDDYSFAAKNALFTKCLSMEGFFGEYFRAVNNKSMKQLQQALA